MPEVVPGEKYIKASDEGLSIKNYVHQPIGYREPVDYNRKFLDSYSPNQSFYLSKSVRNHLATLGRTNGAFTKENSEQFILELSWNSSRLEGNSYSLLEAERLLALNEELDNKPITDAVMIENHKRAIEYLLENTDDITFNSQTIFCIHAILAHWLLTSFKAAGRLRDIPVGISKTSYLPQQNPAVIADCFHEILNKVNKIIDPYEQAFFVMVHLPYLQPFEDVNKRTSRLAANISLIKNNLCPLSFIEVPRRAYIDGIMGVYELNRIELLRDVFVWAYERSAARYSKIK